jgi:hypothetical protein
MQKYLNFNILNTNLCSPEKNIKTDFKKTHLLCFIDLFRKGVQFYHMEPFQIRTLH